MNKSTLTAIGAALIALGQELVNADPSAAPAQPSESPATPEPAKPRRGRPPAEAPTTPEPEKPAAAPEKKAAAPAGAKTEEELRAICTPLIHDGRGEELKGLLTKYGGSKFADLPAENHTAFLRDVEALLM